MIYELIVDGDDDCWFSFIHPLHIYDLIYARSTKTSQWIEAKTEENIA
jgi:hypothetical protein